MTLRGFALVEFVIAIVVLAAASAGVLLIFAQATAYSADPQIRAQARAISAAYMDEILLQRYCEDPPSCSAETSGGGAEEASRSDYDDVWDYKAIGSESPHDQFGNAVAGVGGYTVSVRVDGTPGAGPARITVTTSGAGGRVAYDLYSERANY